MLIPALHFLPHPSTAYFAVDVPDRAYDFDGVQLCVHEQCATPSPTIFLPDTPKQLLFGADSCVLDNKMAVVGPESAYEDVSQYWGYRVQIEEVFPRDPSAPVSMVRYFPLINPYYTEMILCEDELTGLQNPAAPDKPFGKDLYWRGNGGFDRSFYDSDIVMRITVWAVSQAGKYSEDRFLSGTRHFGQTGGNCDAFAEVQRWEISGEFILFVIVSFCPTNAPEQPPASRPSPPVITRTSAVCFQKAKIV